MVCFNGYRVVLHGFGGALGPLEVVPISYIAISYTY
jgi:hypothetical protein